MNSSTQLGLQSFHLNSLFQEVRARRSEALQRKDCNLLGTKDVYPDAEGESWVTDSASWFPSSVLIMQRDANPSDISPAFSASLARHHMGPHGHFEESDNDERCRDHRKAMSQYFSV